jgi:hypothetical protein
VKHNPNSTAKVRCWTIPAPQQPDPEPAAAEQPIQHSRDSVRHGYTMADLDRLARLTVTFHLGWFSGGNRNDQYEAAWHGIVEHLCSVEQSPSERDLLDSGRRALQGDQQRHQQMLGTRRHGTYTGANFARYWDWHARTVPSPEDAVVERVALGQITATLCASHIEALTTLAALGNDVQATAEALGITYQAAKDRLSRARHNFRTHWYAPDPAPPMHRPMAAVAPQVEQRLRAECGVCGTAMTPENTQWEKPRKPGRAPIGHCRTCERARSARRTAARQAAAA